jgi:hypothetical protein
MAPPPKPKPDVSYEPSAGVKTGWSEPIFIIEFDSRLYLTRVVWPYDEAVAKKKARRKTAFDKIKALFDGKPKLQAVNVTRADLTGIIHGFTEGSGGSD